MSSVGSNPTPSSEHNFNINGKIMDKKSIVISDGDSVMEFSKQVFPNGSEYQLMILGEDTVLFFAETYNSEINVAAHIDAVWVLDGIGQLLFYNFMSSSDTVSLMKIIGEDFDEDVRELIEEVIQVLSDGFSKIDAEVLIIN